MFTNVVATPRVNVCQEVSKAGGITYSMAIAHIAVLKVTKSGLVEAWQ